LKAARLALERLLTEEPAIAESAADSVKRSDAYRILDSRKATPVAASKLRGLLASAWDQAHDAGLLDQDSPNWWRDVMRGKLKSKGKIIGGEHAGPARRTLSIDEVRTLLEWLPNMHQIAQDAITLYLWTCARGSEILAMRPEHLREESGVLWWTLPVMMTKNAGKPHAVDLRVPLFGRALEVVRRRLEAVGPQGWLFDVEDGGQYRQHYLSTYVYDHQPYSVKSVARPHRLTLPVTHWTLHDLRRTGRTLLAGLGCPQDVAEAILGHMPAGIVSVYNRHSFDSERVVWLARLSELLCRA